MVEYQGAESPLVRIVKIIDSKLEKQQHTKVDFLRLFLDLSERSNTLVDTKHLNDALKICNSWNKNQSTVNECKKIIQQYKEKHNI